LCFLYLVVRPGGGTGRTATALLITGFRFRAPDSGAGCLSFSIVFLPLRVWRRVTSGLAPSPLFTAPAEIRPVPARRISKPWDCKVTPAYCACQEGNTTGCILNNDGLGAGLRDSFGIRFPQREFIWRLQRQWPVVRGQGPAKPHGNWRLGRLLTTSADRSWGSERSGRVGEICVLSGLGAMVAQEFRVAPLSRRRARVRRCPRRSGEALCGERHRRIRRDSRPCGRNAVARERRRR